MRRVILVVLSVMGSGIAACVFWCLCTTACSQDYAEPKQSLEYPIEIDGTSLVAMNMVCYDGSFLEGDSQEELQQVVGIIIKNRGEYGIAEGCVMIQQGGKELRFLFTQLPPGASVLVLEQAGQQYSGEMTGIATGWTIKEDGGWEPDEILEIQELPPGGIVIRNIDVNTMKELRIFYKPFYSEGNFFLGGRTYDALVGELLPGETAVLYPEHYCCGVSRILRIQYVGQQ